VAFVLILLCTVQGQHIAVFRYICKQYTRAFTDHSDQWTMKRQLRSFIALCRTCMASSSQQGQDDQQETCGAFQMHAAKVD
jgi:hypothetical protein